jgi:tol-pal system protein YbgF
LPRINRADGPVLAPGPQVLGTIASKDLKKGVEAPPAAAPAPTPKDPKAAYDAAYALYQARDYAGATEAFKNFIAKFPEHQLVPSAIFWQGEAAYAQNDYKTAASYFGEGYRKFPSSTKAPDLLYKLGKSFAQLNMTKEACRAFKLLSENHPDMPERLRKASSADRTKLGC